MSVSRKHMEFAAQLVARRVATTGWTMTARCCAELFAEFFAHFNPLFDRARFYEACDVE